MRILFAVDIREPDLDRRLGAGVQWAHRMNGELNLLYVIPDFADRIYSKTDLLTLERAGQRFRDHKLVELEELQQKIPHALRGGVEVKTAFRTGKAIADQALEYELLLLHSHGRTGISRLFMGSVAERVVRTAKTPTLVLRVPE